MWKKIVLACFALFLIYPSVTLADIKDDIPNQKGDIYVQDPYNYLSPSVKQKVNQQAKITDQQTTAQIGFLLVQSLHGNTIQEYAVEAFRKYGLGDPEKNNGVLVVMSIEDRKAWIEVGYGLEGVLPDGKVGRILDEYTTPALKGGNYDAAVEQTYTVLVKEVMSEYNGTATPAKEASGNPFLWAIGLLGGGAIAFVLWKVLTRNMNKEEKAHVLFVFLQLFQVILSAIARNNNGGKGGGNSSGRGGSSGGGGAGRDW
ncbi:TPM domain-containing protein [Priestia taiwanensis]|uniref:TPM domain-containing protein n=1 Tax=Priestia taiwanensis TaxID=1347902 RepID=A0A917AR11_9BACI|nr:TPM domain-containing protein [Priestia taiwanensis]MBM7363293.1 uncharacterized protein [Priestia taiwanensis]GGE69240.1 hypothetical protein GCM10007140_19120 [Priestia taiwanensis]